jgi:hypothetical protein
LSVQKVRQAAAAAAFFALSLRRGRRGLRRLGVAGEAKRFEPLGLGAQNRRRGFVVGRRPVRRLRALQLGELDLCLLPFGIVSHFAVLF